MRHRRLRRRRLLAAELLGRRVGPQGLRSDQLRRMARTRHRRLGRAPGRARAPRSEEHTSELQSLMRISYAVFCLKKKTNKNKNYKLKYTMNNTQTMITQYTRHI